MGWRPLSKRDRADPEYDAIHEGVPPWLKTTIVTYLIPMLSTPDAFGNATPRVDRVQELERRLRVPLFGGGGGSPSDVMSRVFSNLEADDTLVLDVLDIAVGWDRQDEWGHEVSPQLAGLEGALEQAGSAWEVAHYADYSRLERRVDAAVAAAAREVMSVSGRAGQHLRAAWEHVYGRKPSASEGYREAVRAVEAAAIPTVIPRDRGATLGKVIPALRDAPDKWRVVLTHRAARIQSKRSRTCANCCGSRSGTDMA